MTGRKPALVHAGMSAKDMVEVCGLRMRRVSDFRYDVVDPANKKLFTGTMPGIKQWLRKEGYVT